MLPPCFSPRAQLMSVHARFGHGDVISAADLLDPKWVTRHRGSPAAFLARHRRQAKRVMRVGRSALAALAPSLLFRASHDKVLYLAWQYLSEHGGQAPGPDSVSYGDIP